MRACSLRSSSLSSLSPSLPGLSRQSIIFVRRWTPGSSPGVTPMGKGSCAEARDQLGIGIGAEPGALGHLDRAVVYRHGLGIGGEADVAEQALERRGALLGGERVQGREIARPEEKRVR